MTKLWCNNFDDYSMQHRFHGRLTNEPNTTLVIVIIKEMLQLFYFQSTVPDVVNLVNSIGRTFHVHCNSIHQSENALVESSIIRRDFECLRAPIGIISAFKSVASAAISFFLDKSHLGNCWVGGRRAVFCETSQPWQWFWRKLIKDKGNAANHWWHFSILFILYWPMRDVVAVD